MEFTMKLPQSKKEFILFMSIVSIISVNIIAPLLTCFEKGFHMHVFAHTFTIIPYLWLSVIVLVLFTYKPSAWLTAKFVEKDDSFSAHIIINILCSVFLMSVFLTVIGTWIGTQTVSLEPFKMFFYKWPRNFTISFFVESCIAQPIARLVMFKIHQSSAASIKTVEDENNSPKQSS